MSYPNPVLISALGQALGASGVPFSAAPASYAAAGVGAGGSVAAPTGVNGGGGSVGAYLGDLGSGTAGLPGWSPDWSDSIMSYPGWASTPNTDYDSSAPPTVAASGGSGGGSGFSAASVLPAILAGVSLFGTPNGNGQYKAGQADTSSAQAALGQALASAGNLTPFAQGGTSEYQTFQPQAEQATEDEVHGLENNPFTDSFGAGQVAKATSGVANTYLNAKAQLRPD